LSDGGFIRVIDQRIVPQMTFSLRAFFRQYVTFMRVTALYAATSRFGETLCCAPISPNFGHVLFLVPCVKIATPFLGR
jgi:hypothetical protein